MNSYTNGQWIIPNSWSQSARINRGLLYWFLMALGVHYKWSTCTPISFVCIGSPRYMECQAINWDKERSGSRNLTCIDELRGLHSFKTFPLFLFLQWTWKEKAKRTSGLEWLWRVRGSAAKLWWVCEQEKVMSSTEYWPSRIRDSRPVRDKRQLKKHFVSKWKETMTLHHIMIVNCFFFIVIHKQNLIAFF